MNCSVQYQIASFSDCDTTRLISEIVPIRLNDFSGGNTNKHRVTYKPTNTQTDRQANKHKNRQTHQQTLNRRLNYGHV